MTEYITIADSISETVIQKSRFITYAYRIKDEEDAREKIAALKKKHYDSTHVCFAFVVHQNLFRFGDDGEPTGTAGMPILEVIKGEGLCRVLVAVVRYYGGIKLGTGGLVAAYSGSAQQTLAKAERIKVSLCQIYRLTFDYNTFVKVEHKLKMLFAGILQTEYLESVHVNVAAIGGQDIHSAMCDLCHGKIDVQLLGESYLET